MASGLGWVHSLRWRLRVWLRGGLVEVPAGSGAPATPYQLITCTKEGKWKSNIPPTEKTNSSFRRLYCIIHIRAIQIKQRCLNNTDN
ncbi:hypothetical protein Ahy_B04g071547 isoform B [Arachis hypogaea]|uniref:Uncharacterized protein n=1 Tax=Arachis hypogaea TaxID=3818 RepID=A0A444ZKZ9_ARAHY|nr:hypothetical protein Ahy_B04g071547 isoform B [Arachis hypogaea]